MPLNGIPLQLARQGPKQAVDLAPEDKAKHTCCSDDSNEEIGEVEALSLFPPEGPVQGMANAWQEALRTGK